MPNMFGAMGSAMGAMGRGMNKPAQMALGPGKQRPQPGIGPSQGGFRGIINKIKPQMQQPMQPAPPQQGAEHAQGYQPPQHQPQITPSGGEGPNFADRPVSGMEQNFGQPLQAFGPMMGQGDMMRPDVMPMNPMMQKRKMMMGQMGQGAPFNRGVAGGRMMGKGRGIGPSPQMQPPPQMMPQPQQQPDQDGNMNWM